MPVSTSNKGRAAPPGHRGFHLAVEPDANGTFALRLNETNGRPDHTRSVAYLAADRYPKATTAVLSALEQSGHKPRAVGPTRRKPVSLDEAAGVRLALALNVIHGVSKPGRTRALLDGVARLSDEECFYWYAATCAGTPTDSRRTKALRIYLADE